VMAAGRLLQVASPRALYDDPVSTAVARFVGHANLWPATVTAPGEVHAPFGTLRAETRGHPPGSRVSILVRPEAIELAAAACGVNRFAGRVVQDRFLGAIRRFDLALDGGVVLGETTSRAEIAAIHIPPAAIRLLRD
jgi:putative spermidine/putrescine transport system ATP-binding protein